MSCVKYQFEACIGTVWNQCKTPLQLYARSVRTGRAHMVCEDHISCSDSWHWQQ